MRAIGILFDSKFSEKLMTEARLIINKWSSIHAERMSETEYFKEHPTFESVGTQSELETYSKIEKFFAIQNTLNDINKVFTFLAIDKTKIVSIYPEIESQENYFIYHIENYIIRIYTIVDLVGKLGNLLYQTGIQDEDCNCYKFKEKIKVQNIEIGKMLEDILLHVDLIKKRRHKKIHTGEIEIDELKGISFWKDFSEFLPENFDFENPVLKEMNETRFQNMINELHAFLDSLVEKINIFLESSIDKI